MQIIDDEEKRLIVEEAKKGQNLKIVAFAGTGKTYLLKLIAEQVFQNKNGRYLAFNKKNILEGQETFPDNITFQTFHSLAYSSIGRKYKASGKLNGQFSSRLLYGLFENTDNIIIGLSKADTIKFVFNTITAFCYSNADSIDDKFILTRLSISQKNINSIDKQSLVELINHLWNQIISLESDTPVNPDILFKIWALKKPKLRCDFILIDEAQDLPLCFIDLVSRQKCQIIWVGDRHQQVYEWRGAINALDEITNAKELKLTKSYRFGSIIAELCNLTLRSMLNENTRITGQPNINSVITRLLKPDCIIFRTNFALYTTAIELLQAGELPYLGERAGNLPSIIDDIEHLQLGRKCKTDQLKMFNNWEELVKYSESDDGKYIKPFINLTQCYSFKELKRAVKQLSEIQKRNSTLNLTTVHLSKGLQWDSIKIANDFVAPSSSQYKDEDTRLLYVALSRAKIQLDISECEAMDQIIEKALTLKVE